MKTTINLNFLIKSCWILSIFLVGFQSYLDAQTIGVTPNAAFKGQTLTVQFTDPNCTFSPASPCGSATASSVTFSRPPANSFQPSTLNIPLNFCFPTSSVTIPNNVDAGVYDITFSGGCNLSCTGCFTVNDSGPNLIASIGSLSNVYRNMDELFTVNIQNVGSDTVKNGYFKIEKDPDLNVTSSSLPYDNLSADSVSWNLTNFAPGQNITVMVDMRYVGSNIGGTIKTRVLAYPIATDPVPANNVDSVIQTILDQAIAVSPDTGTISKTLQVGFTSTFSVFNTISTCATPTNIELQHESLAYSFYPLSATFINADSISANVGIPSNALIGTYNVRFGGACPSTCVNCFEVIRDSLVMGSDVGIHLTTPNPSIRGNNVQYYLSYQNKGNDTADVDITLIHDALVNYVSATPLFNSRNGDTINWVVNNVLPGEFGSVKVTLGIPSTVPLNTQLSFTTNILPLTADLDSTDNFDTLTQIVIGSYDPNDKLVTQDSLIPIDWEELEYRIRFQNTGTAPAQKVVIVDTLSNDLIANTFRMLGSSHAYSYEIINGSKNIVEWTFNDINLPDSGADWLGSQGFVEFAIGLRPGLKIRDSIENFADIYFDFNLPVRTNTAKNYIFDCDSLANFNLPLVEYCDNIQIEAKHIGFGATELLWDLSGNILDSTPDLTTSWSVPGKYGFNLTASNWYCSNIQTDSIEVFEAVLPEITANREVIVSNVLNNLQWYFNGALLNGANSDTLIALENGWYKVFHVDSNGCESFSDSVQITTVGVNSIEGSFEVNIYPNPSKGEFTVEMNHLENSSLKIEVFDVAGQKVISRTYGANKGQNRLVIDLSDFEKGTYFITIVGENYMVGKPLILIR